MKEGIITVTMHEKIISQIDNLYLGLESYIEGIRDEYPGIQCSAGCSSCCRVNGSPPVTEMEWQYLRLHLDTKEKTFIDFVGDNLQQEIEKIERDLRSPVKVKPEIKCSFLDQSGMCTVYHFRPLTCRLFGYTRNTVPITGKTEEYIYTCNMELERWQKSPVPVLENKQKYLDALKAINLLNGERLTLPLIRRIAEYLSSKDITVKNVELLDLIKFRY